MVIQRWQSVLLLISSVMMILFSSLSLGQISLPNIELNFSALGYYIEGIATDGSQSGWYLQTWPLLTLSVLSSVIPLINIFLFKNFKLQKTLCVVEALFLLALIIVSIIYGYYTIDGFSVSWSSVAFTPFIAGVADFMAYKRIQSDYNKIRSIDRIR